MYWCYIFRPRRISQWTNVDMRFFWLVNVLGGHFLFTVEAIKGTAAGGSWHLKV